MKGQPKNQGFSLVEMLVAVAVIRSPKLREDEVLTIALEPTVEFNDRSGMASSTRKKAIELWRTSIPHGDREHLAEVGRFLRSGVRDGAEHDVPPFDDGVRRQRAPRSHGP